MVNFSHYEIYDPGEGVDRPLDELSRSIAIQAHERLMTYKDERIQELHALLESNSINLGSDEKSLCKLGEWYLKNVQADSNKPNRLKPVWYSVCNDIALFVGQLIVDEHPNIEWRLHTYGKTNISYHRSVLMGFAVKNPKYSVDLDYLIGTYGHRAIKDQENRFDFLAKAYAGTKEKAVGNAT